jgi:hypothetical protein
MADKEREEGGAPAAAERIDLVKPLGQPAVAPIQLRSSGYGLSGGGGESIAGVAAAAGPAPAVRDAEEMCTRCGGVLQVRDCGREPREEPRDKSSEARLVPQSGNTNELCSACSTTEQVPASKCAEHTGAGSIDDQPPVQKTASAAEKKAIARYPLPGDIVVIGDLASSGHGGSLGTVTVVGETALTVHLERDNAAIDVPRQHLLLVTADATLPRPARVPSAVADWQPLEFCKGEMVRC